MLISGRYVWGGGFTSHDVNCGGTPGFPMMDEYLSMPGCLLALIIRRQLPR